VAGRGLEPIEGTIGWSCFCFCFESAYSFTGVVANACFGGPNERRDQQARKQWKHGYSRWRSRNREFGDTGWFPSGGNPQFDSLLLFVLRLWLPVGLCPGDCLDDLSAVGDILGMGTRHVRSQAAVVKNTALGLSRRFRGTCSALSDPPVGSERLQVPAQGHHPGSSRHSHIVCRLSDHRRIRKAAIAPMDHALVKVSKKIPSFLPLGSLNYCFVLHVLSLSAVKFFITHFVP
jgi:hypothetical protein